MKNTKRSLIISPGVALTILAVGLAARADMVTRWNSNLVQAAQTGLLATPPLQGRTMAIVQAAVYNAVNGIVQKYELYFVTEPAPEGARPEAAVAQAAYTTLVALFPAQKANLDAELAASFADIPGSAGHSQSIALGLAWGEHVANAILVWRG